MSSSPPPPPPLPSSASAAHSAASRSSSLKPSNLGSLMTWLLGTGVFGSLDQHFAEQDVLDLHRLGRDPDPHQKFLAQSVDAGRTAQIFKPQLAQVDLEIVHDARHDLLD